MSVPATNALTYNGYITQMAEMAIVPTFTPATNTTINGINYLANVTYGGTTSNPDTNFNTIIPMMLNYAELRIQRDLDLNQSMTTNTYNLSSGNNSLSISVNDFVTLQTFSVTSNDQTVVNAPLIPTTKEFINNVYPYGTGATGTPKYFAVYGGDQATSGNTSQLFIVGPYPDQNYSVLAVGTIRTPSLYQFANTSQAATSTNFISTYLPDLLIMASLVYVSAYQRNFGRMSDDPAQAQSYESQYQSMLARAIAEEYRKKFQASAWSSTSQSAVATPTRGP